MLLSEDRIKQIIRLVIESTVVNTSDPVINSIRDRVIKHEGKKYGVYLDSRGIPTIGVGFNLNRKDSTAILKQIGVNPVKIKSGEHKLNDQQVNKLLDQDLIQSKKDVEDLIDGFNTLPIPVQGVLVEMNFNLGKQGLSKFKNFLNYIKKKRWRRAANEMLDSLWAKQVGQRAKTLSKIISSQSNPKIERPVKTDVWMGKEFNPTTKLSVDNKEDIEQ
jgi:GH24 family phage-related lysozyme (muramidase)